MSALPHLYLSALKIWLDARLIDDPPPPAVPADGLICVGRYQASPTDYSWIASLNQNNPEEEVSTWKHEAMDEPYTIMGGCVSQYWRYRYTVLVTYNMTLSAEEQTIAHDQGTMLVQWLRRQINAATVAALAIPISSMGETAQAQQVKHIAQRELGGPPSSFIASARIYIEQFVIVE